MGDVGSVLFILAVVVVWFYAGYRVVSTSHRKYAALRYVSPLLILGVALMVYASFVSDATATFILAWTLPSFVVVLATALVIDRARNNATEG